MAITEKTFNFAFINGVTFNFAFINGVTLGIYYGENF
jgi:hypothetical protein